MKISRSPVPEIPGFLKRPFIKGKFVKHPIPDDPAESIHNKKCVQTKAQKAWTYLCALLQFWTDQATTESGDVMYGGCWNVRNSLESAVEERWERYLQEGVLKTPDLSFSTPSWASADSMPLLLSEPSEAQQPMGAWHLT